jgi:hypothetical protein
MKLKEHLAMLERERLAHEERTALTIQRERTLREFEVREKSKFQ